MNQTNVISWLILQGVWVWGLGLLCTGGAAMLFRRAQLYRSRLLQIRRGSRALGSAAVLPRGELQPGEQVKLTGRLAISTPDGTPPARLVQQDGLELATNAVPRALALEGEGFRVEILGDVEIKVGSRERWTAHKRGWSVTRSVGHGDQITVQGRLERGISGRSSGYRKAPERPWRLVSSADAATVLLVYLGQPRIQVKAPRQLAVKAVVALLFYGVVSTAVGYLGLWFALPSGDIDYQSCSATRPCGAAYLAALAPMTHKKAELLLFKHGCHTVLSRRLAFAPGGSEVALFRQGYVQLWDILNRTLTAQLDLSGESYRLSVMAFAPGGSLLVIGYMPLAKDAPPGFLLWNSRSGEHRSLAVPSRAQNIESARFSTDGLRVVATVSGEGEAGLLSWSVAGGAPRARWWPRVQFPYRRDYQSAGMWSRQAGWVLAPAGDRIPGVFLRAVGDGLVRVSVGLADLGSPKEHIPESDRFSTVLSDVKLDPMGEEPPFSSTLWFSSAGHIEILALYRPTFQRVEIWRMDNDKRPVARLKVSARTLLLSPGASRRMIWFSS